METTVRSILFRSLAVLATAAATALIAPAPASAQAPQAAADFPSRPLRIIVPFAPGGATDVLARMVGQKLTDAWGQQVIVENRPGAGGNIGAEAGARAAADGYTLTLAAAGFMAVNPSLYAKLPYDSVKDFAPVSLLVKAPLLLVANSTLQARNVRELIDFARANPGKLNIGNGGTGTAQHLGGEFFTSAAGISAVHIPYKGSAPATNDLLAGVFHAQFDNMVTLIPHVKSGKLRPLAVSSAKRVPILPDVPTIAESGLPGFETGTWYGVIAPAATPAPIVDKLNREINRILTLPDVAEKLNGMGLQAAAMSPAQFSDFLRSEIANYARIIKAANIKLD
ncbi:MAG TPA: tripartite tricarboxylate transporter substrate binding protein [Quisquiliibacterium sp.]|nr:MAG: tripartite tricarboxylate transporter substrate binding protein [Burkholderiaceae bacterium]HPA89442.1 tripartite tricarboxylate transporter substrate binding protein [Quisquiliibacterium sp.]HQN13336.1 tripartite tricarboxylate transporter substrate binding protein [Quisquiliibacterium sp.]HQP66777.1 tripartite tricarboxylate transporter substrate binding protein [Quisquiliibacterium sp.]